MSAISARSHGGSSIDTIHIELNQAEGCEPSVLRVLAAAPPATTPNGGSSSPCRNAVPPTTRRPASRSPAPEVEWTNRSDEGHFRIIEAEWLDAREEEQGREASAMLISATDVRMAEFVATAATTEG